MRPIITLAALLALAACENPVDHFTEDPDRGSHTVIPNGPIDSTGADTVRTRGPK